DGVADDIPARHRRAAKRTGGGPRRRKTDVEVASGADRDTVVACQRGVDRINERIHRNLEVASPRGYGRGQNRSLQERGGRRDASTRHGSGDGNAIVGSDAELPVARPRATREIACREVQQAARHCLTYQVVERGAETRDIRDAYARTDERTRTACITH